MSMNKKLTDKKYLKSMAIFGYVWPIPRGCAKGNTADAAKYNK